MTFARGLPKAELHLHIEGTLEPEMMFELGRRNGVELPFASPDEVRTAYEFDDLQSFLDIYYQGAAVLVQPEDFHDLAFAYFQRAAADGVRRAEIFFDPQTHTERGVAMGAVIEGLTEAMRRADEELGLSSGLIMCFLRHLPAASAMATLEDALPYRDHLLGIGLDSSEAGFPPRLFTDVYARAKSEGLRAVAHAGEEGPPDYVGQALDLLGAERIDHGVRSMEDPQLVRRLADEQVPLTVCPLSNVKLRVVDQLSDHPLPAMLEAGLSVSLNSDDPSYFGGYVADNYEAVASQLQLTEADLIGIAKNSFRACFVEDDQKRAFVIEVEEYATRAG